MTKQEKVRKKIRRFFEDNFYADEWHQPLWDIDFAVEVFIKEVLHSQGVVIKRPPQVNDEERLDYIDMLVRNKKVRFVAVEPLIE